MLSASFIMNLDTAILELNLVLIGCDDIFGMICGLKSIVIVVSSRAGLRQGRRTRPNHESQNTDAQGT